MKERNIQVYLYEILYIYRSIVTCKTFIVIRKQYFDNLIS